MVGAFQKWDHAALPWLCPAGDNSTTPTSVGRCDDKKMIEEGVRWLKDFVGDIYSFLAGKLFINYKLSAHLSPSAGQSVASPT